MAWAKADSGTFTGFIDAGMTPTWKISINQADLEREYLLIETTEEGDPDPVFDSSKRMIYRVKGTGWLEDGANNRIRLSDNMSSISGSIYGRNSLAILVRDHGEEPINVTGAEDPVPETHWELGRGVYAGAIRTHLQTTETPLDDATDHNATPATLTLPLGGSKTVSGSVVVTLVRHSPDFRGGGPIQADYRFRFTNAVTVADTPFETDRFDASINLTNGQTMSGTVLMLQLRCDLDYRRDSPVLFQFTGIFTGAVNFV